MWIADGWNDYEVIDTSSGEKLERWGNYTLVRPDPQVIWNTPKADRRWKSYDGRYARSNTGGGQWSEKRLPERWQVKYGPLTFNVKPMNFKHTGIFPEQAVNWDFSMEQIKKAGRPVQQPCDGWPRSGGRKPAMCWHRANRRTGTGTHPGRAAGRSAVQR